MYCTVVLDMEAHQFHWTFTQWPDSSQTCNAVVDQCEDLYLTDTTSTQVHADDSQPAVEGADRDAGDKRHQPELLPPDTVSNRTCSQWKY